jgi:hypothetical protein
LPRRVVAALLAGAALAAGAGLPAGAEASHDQTVYFEAPRDLLNAATRDRSLAELDGLGVRALRVVLYWRSVAPAAASRTRPAFDATDPAGYRWGQYDALVSAAAQRGWSLLMTVSGPVPRWATAGARDNVTRPSALEFGRFMTAVGRRYGDRVATWSVWNEPNHPQFLAPQFVGRRPASPRIYRGLFQAAIDGLHAAGLNQARVLMGETAPRGTGHDVAPLTFLRGALCLDTHYRRSPSCSTLAADGYAHHAYTTVAGPFFRPPGPNDVTIGVLSRLTRALDRAAQARAVPHRLDVYLTEFGIQSKPNPFLGVSLARQAEYQELSELIAWSNPRVRAFSQYLLRDDPQISRPGGSTPGGGYIGFQSGLRLARGRAKPALAGFRLPLTVRRHGGHVSLWGLVRPARRVSTVELLTRDGTRGRWRLATVLHTDASGYWTARAPYRPRRRWRVRWRTPGGPVQLGAPIRSY